MAKRTQIQQYVEEILAANQRSAVSKVRPRDSDRELLVQILELKLGMKLTTSQIAILRSVSFESITRARRKLQEDGKYLPSPEVAKARRLKGYEVQQSAPMETAEGLQRRIESN